MGTVLSLVARPLREIHIAVVDSQSESKQGCQNSPATGDIAGYFKTILEEGGGGNRVLVWG